VHRLRPFYRAGTQLLSRSSAGDRERDPGRVPQPDDVPAENLPFVREVRPPILVVCGPTGTGKSQLASLVALRLRGEVVGCDALQVYRGLDAATAKPSRDERERVPHWLLDVADPRRDYSLAEYVRDADAAIASILARGGVPVVAGGSGMYLRGLLKGIVPVPPRDEMLRARLNAQIARFGARRVHRLLATLDPESARRVRPEDAQRIVRALELALRSAETWSATLARAGTWAGGEERYRALKFGLDLDRGVLASRLAARVDTFFEADLPGEVERLLAEGVPESANAWKGIGYREILRARRERRDPAEMREAIVIATRQYAKRQRTWFRKEPGLVWLDASVGIDALVQAVVYAWHAARAQEGAGSAC
jgi:tRNA dimethylallyltransferase